MTTIATETWTGTSGAWPAQWVTTGTTALNANRGALTTTGAAYTPTVSAYLNGMTATRDIDVTVDVTFSNIDEQYHYLLIRTSQPAAGSTPSNAYSLDFYPGNGVNSVGVSVFSGGNETALSGDLAAGQWVAGTAKRVRFQALANTIRVKVWDPASAEPGTWLYSTTNAVQSAATGKVAWVGAVGGPSAARTAYLDNLTVTNDGTTTPTGDTTPPTVPTGLTATAVSPTQVNLSWTASTDAVGVTGYDIYRGGISLTSVAGTTYSDTSVTASTLYTYTVRAKDAASNLSAFTSGVNVTTPAALASMPNQVSATTYTTTTAGTVIYKYEVKTDANLTGLDTQAFVYVPSGQMSASSTKMVIATSGLGDVPSTFMEQSGITAPLLNLLADAGYVVIVPSCDETMGNPTGQARMRRAYDYLLTKWTTAGTVLFGFSMGGLNALVAWHQNNIPNIKAIQLVAPLADLSLFSESTYPYEMGKAYAAYGVSNRTDFDAATANVDPVRVATANVAKYSNIRVRINSSNEDTYPMRQGSLNLLGKIAGVAAQATDVSVTGGHGQAAEFVNPDAMVSFFNTAIAATRVLDRWNGTSLVRVRSDRWDGSTLMPQTYAL